jgi:hypothetical protein
LFKLGEEEHSHLIQTLLDLPETGILAPNEKAFTCVIDSLRRAEMIHSGRDNDKATSERNDIVKLVWKRVVNGSMMTTCKIDPQLLNTLISYCRICEDFELKQWSLGIIETFYLIPGDLPIRKNSEDTLILPKRSYLEKMQRFYLDIPAFLDTIQLLISTDNLPKAEEMLHHALTDPESYGKGFDDIKGEKKSLYKNWKERALQLVEYPRLKAGTSKSPNENKEGRLELHCISCDPDVKRFKKRRMVRSNL